MIIALSVLSGVLYRLGGMKGFNTKVRDFGVPLVCLAYMLSFVAVDWWVHAISAVLLFASLTTYWQFIHGEDDFYIHGAGIGLAYLAYSVVVPWWIICVRAVLLSLFMGGLNWAVHKFNVKHSDDIEELSRGFVTCLSLALFKIIA